MLRSREAYGTNRTWSDAHGRCQLSSFIATTLWERLVETEGARIATYKRSVLAEFQMRHTAPLLLMAAETAELAGDGPNAEYFRKHHEEEASHHAWGLADLREASKHIPEGLRDIELPASICRLIFRQYDSLANGDFRAFLGYIVALEGFPGERKYWVNFADRNGISRACFRSPIRHAVLDRAHSHELFEHIELRYRAADERERIFEEARDCIAMVAQALCEPFTCRYNDYARAL